MLTDHTLFRRVFPLFALLCAAFAACGLYADNGRWDNDNADNDWNNPANWVDGGIDPLSAPGDGLATGDVATFNTSLPDATPRLSVGPANPLVIVLATGAGNVVIDLNGNDLVLQDVTFANGTTLTFTNSLAPAPATVTFPASYAPPGGALTIDTGVTIAFEADLNLTNLTFSNNGTLRLAGGAAQLITTASQPMGRILVANASPVTFLDALTLDTDLSAEGVDAELIFDGAVLVTAPLSLILEDPAPTGNGSAIFRGGLTIGDATAATTVNLLFFSGTYTFGSDITLGLDGGGGDTILFDASDAATRFIFGAGGATILALQSAPLTTLTGGGINLGACTIDEDDALVVTGDVLHTAEITFESLTLDEAATFNLGRADMLLFSDLGLASGAAIAQDADNPGDLTIASDATITGALAFDGSLTTLAGTTVELGADGVDASLTLGGLLDIGGAFNIWRDAIPGDETLTLALQDLVVRATGTVELGEARWEFGGSVIDLSAADDLVSAAALDDAGDDPTIHLTGDGVMLLLFSDNGSIFWADSIASGRSVLQDGTLLLRGNLVFDGSASWDVIDAPSTNTDATIVRKPTILTDGENGLAAKPTNAALLSALTNIVVANGNVSLPPLTLDERGAFDDAGTPGDASDDLSEAVQVALRRASLSGMGALTITGVTIRADSTDADAGLDDRNVNALYLWMDCVIDGALTLEAVASSAGDSAPILDVRADPSLTGAPDPNLVLRGLSVAAATGANASGQVTLTGSGTLSLTTRDNTGGVTVGNGGSLTVSRAVLSMGKDTALTVSGGGTASLSETAMTSTSGSWSIAAASAETFTLSGGAVSAASAGGLSVTVGGMVTVENTLFSNLNASGLSFADNVVLAVFSSNTLSGGSAGGSHITFLGDARGDGGRLLADGNTFDDSTLGGDTFTANAGRIVKVNPDGQYNVEITFRSSGGFGASGFALTAADAELDDADDTSSGGGDNDLIWDDALNALHVSASAAAPATIYAGVSTGASTMTTAFLFNVEASGPAISVNVSSLAVTLEISGLTAGEVVSGSADDIAFFRDFNGDGAWDDSETIDADSGATLATTGLVTFSGFVETLFPGFPQTWGIALRTDAAARGTLRLSIALGAATSSADLVTGLPYAAAVSVEGAFALLAAQGVAAVNAAANLSTQLEGNHVVLAFTLSNAGNTTASVSGVTLNLVASWSDTLAFDPNLAFDALTAFVDGAAAGAATGNGLLTADGTNDQQLGTLSTASIAIAAGAGGGGGLNTELISFFLSFGTNTLEIPVGGTKTVYAAFALTDEVDDYVLAQDERLDLRLSLASIGAVTTLGADDQFQPLAGAINGRTLSFRAPKVAAAASGCSLSGGTRGCLWVLIVLALGVAVRFFRRGRHSAPVRSCP